MSQKANAMTADDRNRMEPGIGLAMLTVFVMLLVTGILAALIYLLMIAISPIEQRTPRAGAAGAPAVEQQAAPPVPAPGIPSVQPTPAPPSPAK